MNGTEGITVSDWLNDTLVADATLQGLLGGSAAAIADRVNEGLGPVGTGYPQVVFTVGEGRIVGTIVLDVMGRYLVTVKVVGKGTSYGPLVAIQQRIWVVLANQVNRMTSLGTILSCVRDNTIQYPEQADGVPYRHLGATYRIDVQ